MTCDSQLIAVVFRLHLLADTKHSAESVPSSGSTGEPTGEVDLDSSKELFVSPGVSECVIEPELFLSPDVSECVLEAADALLC